ncbi:hypothetical protein BJV78DRAFT_1352513 [Lactifluus subvellereus]|nr:hypothetical protein BJV78DRAFT_1352513 [Lactifluus subvellereus]
MARVAIDATKEQRRPDEKASFGQLSTQKSRAAGERCPKTFSSGCQRTAPNPRIKYPRGMVERLTQAPAKPVGEAAPHVASGSIMWTRNGVRFIARAPRQYVVLGEGPHRDSTHHHEYCGRRTTEGMTLSLPQLIGLALTKTAAETAVRGTTCPEGHDRPGASASIGGVTNTFP